MVYHMRNLLQRNRSDAHNNKFHLHLKFCLLYAIFCYISVQASSKLVVTVLVSLISEINSKYL